MKMILPWKKKKTKEIPADEVIIAKNIELSRSVKSKNTWKSMWEMKSTLVDVSEK